MNSYLFTIVFLLMMSLLTSSEVIQFSQDSLEIDVFRKSRTLLAAAKEMSAFADLEQLREEEAENEPDKEQDKKPKEKKKKEPKKDSIRSPALGFNTSRPPNNSRINFFLLLKDEGQEDVFSLYEVMAQVMRSLYGKEPFFTKVPDAEYRILDKFIEKREETASFSTPDELSVIFLDDDELQEIFYRMLKGTESAPSLLNYITYDQGKEPLKGERGKINLMFADPFVLSAILQDERTTQRLLEAREAVWAEIIQQEDERLVRPKEECKGRREFKNDLEEALIQILTDGGFDAAFYKSKVFDLCLGDMGSIIFVEDPLTGGVVRSKFKDGAHTKHKK